MRLNSRWPFFCLARRSSVCLAAVAFVVVTISTPRAQQSGPRNTLPEPAAVSPVLALQVLLDRAHFSPGEIDGRRGANTTRALAAFAAARKLPARLTDAKALSMLKTPDVEVLTSYVITEADVAGPFLDELPDDMMARSTLPALNYTSVVEALGERFHASPALLRSLNPGAEFVAGSEIQVPNVSVEPPVVSSAVRVVVSRGQSTLTVEGAEGEVVFVAPVTSGSTNDPLPIGSWKVTRVQHNPVFHYNPDLFWDADPAHAKAKVAPGPNNPVGLIWIGIDKEHYGLHGTPEPRQIGHTASHGCVRLTNWDALKLSALVSPGTMVEFTE